MVTRFEVREDHFKLLKICYVDWVNVEYGAPGIDPKRPYGNSGHLDILWEIADTLGVPHLGWDAVDGDDWDDSLCGFETMEVRAHIEKTHRDLEHVVQIIFNTTSFVPGWYERESYGRPWVFVQGLTEA